ncbi:type IV secretion system DNA-binding domain-containing protein [Candidatus Gracilibacteria bacterium]|nr:type IV secretion system DNA-binding domain-containing protein [Candidatus Gracilibacteria bacterium]
MDNFTQEFGNQLVPAVTETPVVANTFSLPWFVWVFIVIFGLLFLTFIFRFWLRYWHRRREFRNNEFVHLKITLPRNDSKLDNERRTEKDFREAIGKGQQLFRSLHETRDLNLYNKWINHILWKKPDISLELQFENRQLSFVIVCDEYYQNIIQKQITSFYESAEIEILSPEERFVINPQGSHVNGYYFHTERPFWYPIETYKKIEDDALNTLSNSFSKLTQEEKGVLQIVIHPTSNSWRKRAQREGTLMFKGKKSHGFRIPVIGPILNVLLFPFKVFIRGYDSAKTGSNAPGASGGDSYVRMLQSDEETAKSVGEKANTLGFETIIRVLVSSPEKNRVQEMLNGIFVAFNIFEGKGTNRFENRRVFPINKWNAPLMVHNFNYRLPSFLEKTSLLCTEELATIFHFPDARYNKIPTIKWLPYKVLPPPIDLPTEGIILGKSKYRGVEKMVRIKREDRTRHQYILGKSGSGKSVLLWNMAVQDIQNGEGVCVIDPHGDLVEDIAACIPKERAKDVVLFDPSDRERPMGLNILEAETEEEKDRASLDAMEIFIKLFGNEIFGPRIQHYFRNACLTLMADKEEGATLIDVPRMFIDDDFQKYKVSKVKNPVVRAFWENEMAQTGDREKQEMIPYFTSKFGPFVTNTTMRNVIGQTKSAFNLREAMDQGKIVLINLSKGKIGGINAQLLGLVIVSKINMAAMARADMPKEKRKDFYLYVDEFQNFATDTFASILSEARKYRLNLIMAHQYIAQLSEGAGGVAIGQKDSKIKDAVFGNVGTMMNFKVGAEDAEYLEKEYAPDLSQQDIIGISNYKAYIKLNIDNSTSRPFSLATLYDPSLKNDKVLAIVKKYSRMKFGRKKAFVDAEIEARMGIDNLSIISEEAKKDPTVNDDLLTEKPETDSLNEAKEKNESQVQAVPEAAKMTPVTDPKAVIDSSTDN